MLAVITGLDVGMLPVAGAPLIARQLEWLRGIGCERVAVEVRSAELARWLSASALAMDVVPVPTVRPLGARRLAAAAGFPAGVRLLVLPAEVLGDGDLSRLFLEPGDVVAHLHRPFEGTRAATVALLGGEGEARAILGPGWGMRITSLSEAMTLGGAVLSGIMPRGSAWPIQIHAAERAPGVWLGRGARLEEGVRVEPPVLVGAGALVRRGASLGPCAFIGERSVIEPGAHVAGAMVAPNLIVGEGMVVEGALAEKGRLTPLDGRRPMELEDPLRLGRRDGVGELLAALWRGLFPAPQPLVELASARSSTIRNWGSRRR